jgi:hypothetical protein
MFNYAKFTPAALPLGVDYSHRVKEVNQGGVRFLSKEDLAHESPN